jgi:curved DNA-binding protein CbpA
MSASNSALKDYYQILGVSETATPEEIKTKYRGLVLKHHPDVSASDDAEQTFIQLQEAFEVLGDEQKRFKYDEDRRLSNAPTFRGEPWPSRKYKYRPKQTSTTTMNSSWTTDEMKKKSNIPEWERAHYGIHGPIANRSTEFWPTGEKDENLTNHQLYFKYRAQRLSRGPTGTPWYKKFCTLSLGVLRNA